MVILDAIRNSNIMTEEGGGGGGDGISKSCSFKAKKHLSELTIPERRTNFDFAGDEAYNNLMEVLNEDFGGVPSEFDSVSPDVMHNMRSPVARLSVPSSSPIPGSPLSNMEKQPSDLELLKERFSRLLLGQDMLGSTQTTISSALALSNAITHLGDTVIGRPSKLEPIAPEKKQRWQKEMSWFLSVTDHIVELVPSEQVTNGKSLEIMVTQQRKDLKSNIPGLRKLDAGLIQCLDKFKDQKAFWYVSKNADDSEKAGGIQIDRFKGQKPFCYISKDVDEYSEKGGGGGGVEREDKWRLAVVKLPPNGLTTKSRNFLLKLRDAVSKVLEAIITVNAQALAAMEIPEDYIDSLPKNGKTSLGETIYKNITVKVFKPDELLSSMDITSESKVIDLKNRIEASIVIWKRKMLHTEGKSWGGSAVRTEKRELFEDRAETLLTKLKHRFPGVPRSSLDISKIKYNKDVGYAILESYSRVLERFAHTVMILIEQVINADFMKLEPSLSTTNSRTTGDTSHSPITTSGMSSPLDQESSEGKLSSATVTPTSISNSNSAGTLFDVMGWDLEGIDSCSIKSTNSVLILEDILKDEIEDQTFTKPTKDFPHRKFSYTDQVESGLRSPTSRD